MWWLRSRMKIQERFYISRQSINPCHPNISIHVNTCDRKRLGVTWPDSNGHVCRLPFTVVFRAKQFQVLVLPRSEERRKFNLLIPFLWCCANVCVVSREIREPRRYLSSKNKKIRDTIDSRVQLVWRLQVMGSCYNQSVWNAGNQSCSHSFCLKWRTSNFCVIQDDGEHVDFFSRKPTSI